MSVYPGRRPGGRPRAGVACRSSATKCWCTCPAPSGGCGCPPVGPGTEVVARSGEVILLLGLDPLPQSADAAKVDAYLDAALAADRLLFGRARTR